MFPFFLVMYLGKCTHVNVSECHVFRFDHVDLGTSCIFLENTDETSMELTVHPYIYVILVH